MLKLIWFFPFKLRFFSSDKSVNVLVLCALSNGFRSALFTVDSWHLCTSRSPSFLFLFLYQDYSISLWPRAISLAQVQEELGVAMLIRAVAASWPGWASETAGDPQLHCDGKPALTGWETGRGPNVKLYPKWLWNLSNVEEKPVLGREFTCLLFGRAVVLTGLWEKWLNQ